jgi:tRNA(fMet)-specific endonuclease VapC
MGQKYLIDTNTVIKYLDEIFSHEALSFIDRIVDNDSKVSFITKIELLVWKTANPDDLIIRKDFLKGSKIYYIDEKIIEMTIMIRKATNMKIPDAIIAATAISYDYILLSDNDHDFTKVKPLGLKYLNPKTAFPG